jgi:Rhodanese-related sulfurtransferase
MKTTRFITITLAVLANGVAFSAEPNPAIDYPAFLSEAKAVQSLRESRRVSEGAFLRMAAEPDTVVLDARSADRFVMRHVKGAVNLPLPDFSEEALARIIPSKTTRILIYCNNNFDGDPVAMPSKVASTSLNIYTFNSLYAYGYRNVYELAPLRDVAQSRLPFEGTRILKSPPFPKATSFEGIDLQKTVAP